MNRRYFGNAGHFIGGSSCRFHLTTLVNGTHIVSTVGEYHPRGDKQDAPSSVGYNRLFESMVFETGGEVCSCGCGLPKPVSWSEVDFDGYMTAKEATEGHEALCAKYETINEPQIAAGA